MGTLFGCDGDVIDNRPRRLRVMHRMYGRNATHTCGQCKHLITKEYAGTYFKCDLTRQSNGPGTDWRVRWEACGRWEEKE